MALEKLKIKAEKDQEGDFAEEIEVLFNPNQLQIDKTGWRLGDGYPVAANELATLTINLFFDTTLSGSPPENVQKYTKKIFNLTHPKIGTDTKSPPRCKLTWGSYRIRVKN